MKVSKQVSAAEPLARSNVGKKGDDPEGKSAHKRLSRGKRGQMCSREVVRRKRLKHRGGTEGGRRGGGGGKG